MRGPRRRLADLRRSRVLSAEVERLIESGEVAVLNPYLGMDGATAREVADDVVDDFVRTYGRHRVPDDAPGGTVLLHHPLALLELPATHAEYLENVGPKARNTIRKAAKTGYEFREFLWNDHLDEIYDVNTSKEIRQGEPMKGWYAEPVPEREEAEDERRFKKYYGVFRDGRLCGYLHLVLCGDFGFFRHFLGHAEHLTNGIMNGLISWTVDEYAGHPRLRWLKYGALLAAGDESMAAFRRHAGFRAYATFLSHDVG